MRTRTGVGRVVGIGLALIATAAPVACAAAGPPRATLRFPADRSVVELPFERSRGLIVVGVEVEGVGPLRMVLDSGCPIVVLTDPKRARSMNLRIVGRTEVGGSGTGPPVLAPLASGVSLRVGDLAISDALVIVGVARDVLAGLDGVIGGPLFENSAVEIDWSSRVVRFHDPQRFEPSGSDLVRPLAMLSDRHFTTPVSVSVDGDTSLSLDLVVDTGATQPLGLLRAAIPGLPAPARAIRDTIVAWGSRGASRGDVARSARIEIGDLALADVPTSLPAETSDAEEQGWIGIPVLARFDPTFDLPHRRLILHPRDGAPATFPVPTTGLVIAPPPVDGPVTVAEVIPGSPADAAGVRAGDRIVTVDGQPARRVLAADDAMGPWAPSPGTKVALSIERNGANIERTLEPRALL